MKRQPPLQKITYIDLVSGMKPPEKSFYLLTGSDTYAFSQVEKVFTELFLSDDPSMFNRVRIDCGGNTRGEEIVNPCEEYPFGARYKLVIAYNANRMKNTEGEKIKRYLDSPADTTILVVSENEEELKSGSSGKFYPSRTLKNQLKNCGIIIACKLDFRETRDWARKQFENLGKEIDGSALNLLIEMVGNELWDLNQEIDKLSLYAGTRRKVGIKDVQAVASSRPQSKIFNLTEKAGTQNVSEAMKILDELLREKTPEVMIVTALNNHFAFLSRLRRLMDQGESSESIAKKLRKHPFYVKKSMSQASRFSESALETIFDLLARADGGLKSGMNSRNVIELTLIQICRQK